MTAKEILEKVKSYFADPVPSVAPPMPDVPSTGAVVGYAVDGGQPVYVDISDDSIPDIDAGDPVYSDQAKTTPYPDGDYKVTGTDFGFSVAGGVVTTVTDPDNKGAGVPMQDAKQDPKTTDVPPPPPAPTFEERLAKLEEALAKLTATPAFALPTGLATEVQLQEAVKKIEKQDEVIKGLFEIAEKLAETPTAEPITLNGNKKEQFEKKEKREKKIQGIAAAITQMKNK
jgi:hypothetical protein